MVSVYLKTKAYGFVALHQLQIIDATKVYICTTGPAVVLDLSRIVISLKQETVNLWLDSNSYMCNIQVDDGKSFEGILVKHVMNVPMGWEYIVNKLQSKE